VRSFHAASIDELRAIAGATHDAHFDPDEVVHDEAAHTLVVPFAQEAGEWQEMPQMELVRRSWRVDEYRVPFMRGALTIHDVVEIQVKDGWGDMGMLVGVGFDESAMQVKLKSESTLRVTVSNLRVEADLTDEVVGHARRRVGRITRISTSGPPREAHIPRTGR